MELRADHVRSLPAEKLHLAVGTSAPRCREGDGGADVGLGRSPTRRLSSSACMSGAELLEEQQRYRGSVASTAKEAGVMRALCEHPQALGKWGGLHPHHTPAETPCYAAVPGCPVKPHPYLNTIV